jgi:hypothetical protein
VDVLRTVTGAPVHRRNNSRLCRNDTIAWNRLSPSVVADRGITFLPVLNTLSCRGSSCENRTISNCPSLSY